LCTPRDSESGAEGLSGVCVNEVEEDQGHDGLDRFGLSNRNTLRPLSVYCCVS
jgi:hypothetical protein